MLPLASADGVFAEEMPELPRVSGQRLLGVHMGEASGGFDRDAFRVLLGSGVGGGPVCVKVTTRDGRYWSLNAFATEGVGARAPAIDFRTSFADRLAAYDLADFAVRVVAKPVCDDDLAGPIVPATLSGEAPDALVLMVNGGNPLAVGARLVADGVEGETVRCAHPAAGVMVGYNFVCRIPVGDRTGEVGVRLAIKDMSGISKVEEYRVLLP